MKHVIILVGIPGAGKSSFANKAGGAVVSADAYFTNTEGDYDFDAVKIGDAHADCLRKFVDLLQAKEDSIIVDNTNTRVSEIAPYAALALAYGYSHEIIIIECSIDLAITRNTHDVPAKTISDMALRINSLQSELPPYWTVIKIKSQS